MRLNRENVKGMAGRDTSAIIKSTIKMEGGFYGRIKKESYRKIRK